MDVRICLLLAAEAGLALVLRQSAPLDDKMKKST